MYFKFSHAEFKYFKNINRTSPSMQLLPARWRLVTRSGSFGSGWLVFPSASPPPLPTASPRAASLRVRSLKHLFRTSSEGEFSLYFSFDHLTEYFTNIMKLLNHYYSVQQRLRLPWVAPHAAARRAARSARRASRSNLPPRRRRERVGCRLRDPLYLGAGECRCARELCGGESA